MDFQPGAALLLGVLVFALHPEELAALILAVTVHELGHWLMLRILGVRIYGLTITMTGPVLKCEPLSAWNAELLAALSGPASGLLLWLLTRTHWPLLGEISLFLSLLNLLPARPLDGGRALWAVCSHLFGDVSATVLCNLLRTLLCVTLLCSGIYAAASGYGITLAVFAAWLTVLACQANGIVVK